MKMSIDEFRKKFPHLAREILDDEGLGIALSFEHNSGDLIDPWHNYTPGVEDYIRRCRTVDEAYEVIDYLEKRGEISREEAEKYREKLRKEGLEAFGPRKGDDYYYRKAYEYWRKIYRRKTISQQ